MEPRGPAAVVTELPEEARAYLRILSDPEWLAADLDTRLGAEAGSVNMHQTHPLLHLADNLGRGGRNHYEQTRLLM